MPKRKQGKKKKIRKNAKIKLYDTVLIRYRGNILVKNEKDMLKGIVTLIEQVNYCPYYLVRIIGKAPLKYRDGWRRKDLIKIAGRSCGKI